MIQLTEKLVMTADKHCYIVGEPKQRPGRPFEIKEPKYYSTAAQSSRALYTRPCDNLWRMAVSLHCKTSSKSWSGGKPHFKL